MAFIKQSFCASVKATVPTALVRLSTSAVESVTLDSCAFRLDTWLSNIAGLASGPTDMRIEFKLSSCFTKEAMLYISLLYTTSQLKVSKAAAVKTNFHHTTTSINIICKLKSSPTTVHEQSTVLSQGKGIACFSNFPFGDP